MVKDKQVKGLFMSMSKGKTLSQAADRADMCENTARKYYKSGKFPSEVAQPHTWRTRKDPFEEVWSKIEDFLINNKGIEAKTIFDYLQRSYPGRFQDGQLRTLQRRLREWSCLYGSGKEVYFEQVHTPGELGASDFTDMSKLGITIQNVHFEHLIYHYVLTWSNWEHGSICFSESFESLSAGLQNALWHCGGVPRKHRTDRLSSAVNNLDEKRDFTSKYNGVLKHYQMEGQKTNPNSGNENGDIEQRHHRFKIALDQALMLRGSRDFASRQEYEEFLEKLFMQLNRGRKARFDQERACLQPLPSKRLPAYTEIRDVLVSKGSTITVRKNIYSVHSRLRDQHVVVRLYSEHVEVYFSGRKIQCMQRLRGTEGHEINYRHIIDWLVRKPGAFANYRFKADMFPTSNFRIAYDALRECHSPFRADKEYLSILHCAAQESELLVNQAISILLNEEKVPCSSEITALVHWMRSNATSAIVDITVNDVELSQYDMLLECAERKVV